MILAIKEIRRLGLYGLTSSELRRYSQSILGDVAQHAAQSEQLSSEDVLSEIMEAHANGHTFLRAQDRYAASAEALQAVTLEEVNGVARELCEHLSHIDVSKGIFPAATIACAPVVGRDGKYIFVYCFHFKFTLLSHRTNLFLLI